MSFGGFIGTSSGGSDSSRGARMVADGLYNPMPTAAMAQPHLVPTPISQSMFNSSPLSLAIQKPKMENFGEMGFLRENFDSGLMGRSRDDDLESRSLSDNLEVASGDDQDSTPGSRSSKRKKYNRHTPFQIQELEAAFKDNPHPDEKARLLLGKRLGLEGKQVKFWFQNRRTQMKTQLERHENAILKQENEKLRIENIAMKEAMRNPMCSNCGGHAILGEISMEEHHLRIENARLRDELSRLGVLTNKFLGRPLSSLAGPMPPGMSNPGLDLSMGRNGFGGLDPADSALAMGFDFSNGVSSTLQIVPPTRPPIGLTSNNLQSDKSVFLELALAAMDELMKLAQLDGPLWFRSLDGSGETLNLEEYGRTFPPCIGMKPSNFVTEATRSTGTLMINSMALMDILMDENRWTEMFPCIIGRTSADVISTGINGSKDDVLQLMHAELQVLSPLVPVRQAKFLRYCKQHAEGVWAVVDVSVDTILGGSTTHSSPSFRRLPSGCIVQDMPNGHSKVTWVEHTEYDESIVHQMNRPLVQSGLGFGAKKWVTSLQRQCEFLSVMMSSTLPDGDHTALTISGRRSLAKLAQRMTRNFCFGVCATVHTWEVVQPGSADAARLMMRKSTGNLGEPSGIVLSAVMTVWLPISPQRLFDFLRDEQMRNHWDVLSQDGPMQQMLNISKGHDLGNNISLLRAAPNPAIPNQNAMLVLQDTCTDASGSLVVHAAVDPSSMSMVMSGGDSSCVAFLPSGFAIFPDCFQDSGRTSNNDGGSSGGGNSSGGSLLTVGFQILVSNSPAAKLTVESVDTVNTLISRTLQGIKTALHCN